MAVYIPCGSCTDPSTRILYIALRETSANRCGILAYAPHSVLVQKAAWLLTDFTLTGGALLDFAAHVSMWVIGKDLYLTDGKNPPRKINLAKGYNSGSLTEGDISAVPYAPLLPVSVTSSSDALLGTTPLQKMAVQFVVSYIYDNKTYSVLGPYSPTLPPAYIAPYGSVALGNIADIALQVAEKIPETAAEVELYYRDMDNPNYHGLIKRWRKSNATEAAEIAAHNGGGATLSFRWDGSAVVETLEKERYAVPFSNMPLKAGTGMAAGNASLLGDTTTGYPAAPAQAGVTVSVGSSMLVIDEMLVYAEDGYYIVQRPGGNNQGATGGEIVPIYYAYIIRHNGKWYWVKDDGYFGVFYNFNIRQGISGNLKVGRRKSDDKITVFYPPAYVIPISRLVALESMDPSYTSFSGIEIAKVLSEIHGYPDVPSAADGNPGETYQNQAQFQIQADQGPIVPQPRLFAPLSRYRWGLQYRDAARRGCGVANVGTFSGNPFKCINFGTMEVADSAVVNLPSGNQNAIIPDWAKSVSVTRSENTVFMDAVYGRIQSARYAYYNPDGGFAVNQDITTLWTLAGIAIPVADLSVMQSGYAYKQGDRCAIMMANLVPGGPATYESYEGEVLGVSGGYVILGRLHASGSSTDQTLNCCQGLALPAYKEHIPYNISPANPTIQMDRGLYANRGAFISVGYYMLYTPRTDNPPLHDTGLVSLISRDANGNRSFAQNTMTLRGDFFWRSRKSSGIDVNLPAAQAVAGGAKTADDLSRIAPEDLIGEQRLSTNMVWTEDAQPTALRNASGMVLPASYKTLDTRYGRITAFVATGGIEKEGAVALALCESGAYALSIRRTVLTEGDGQGEVIALSKDFIGTVQEAGRYGCRSPRTIAAADGVAMWYDATYQVIVYWDGSRPVAISDGTIAAAVKYATDGLTPGQISALAGGIHPRTGEYFLCMPARPGAVDELPTTGFQNPFAPFPRRVAAALVYNYKGKKWVGVFHGREHTINGRSIDSPIELYATVGDQLFTFWRNALYKEFTAQNDSYYGLPPGTQMCGMALVFNEGYPAEKTPMVITADSTHMPNMAWLTANDTPVLQVAATDRWKGRGGSYGAAVLRERSREGHMVSIQSGDTAQMSGPVLRGKSVRLWLRWVGEWGVAVRSVSVKWKALGGKMPPKG